jgi:hypothetical protein
MAKRSVAIILGLVLCVSLTGCTMTAYFGGWARIGGSVAELDSDGVSHLPLAGVQVTLTSASDESMAHIFQSDADGRWDADYWLRRDRYLVTFELEGYASVSRTVELSERWAQYDIGPVIMAGDSEPTS